MPFEAFYINNFYMYCIWNYIVEFTTISPLGQLKYLICLTSVGLAWISQTSLSLSVNFCLFISHLHRHPFAKSQKRLDIILACGMRHRPNTCIYTYIYIYRGIYTHSLHPHRQFGVLPIEWNVLNPHEHSFQPSEQNISGPAVQLT